MSTLNDLAIPVVISAVISYLIAAQNINVKNITKERKKWRDNVRIKSLEVHDAMINEDQQKLRRLRAEFMAMLNPKDLSDQMIIDLISLPDNVDKYSRADEFASLIAFLLKHDWERAKLEAGSFVMRVNFLRNAIKPFFYTPPRQY